MSRSTPILLFLISSMLDGIPLSAQGIFEHDFWMIPTKTELKADNRSGNLRIVRSESSHNGNTFEQTRYRYDHDGRLVSKAVSSTSKYCPLDSTSYQYDTTGASITEINIADHSSTIDTIMRVTLPSDNGATLVTEYRIDKGHWKKLKSSTYNQCGQIISDTLHNDGPLSIISEFSYDNRSIPTEMTVDWKHFNDDLPTDSVCKEKKSLVFQNDARTAIEEIHKYDEELSTMYLYETANYTLDRKGRILKISTCIQNRGDYYDNYRFTFKYGLAGQLKKESESILDDNGKTVKRLACRYRYRHGLPVRETRIGDNILKVQRKMTKYDFKNRVPRSQVIFSSTVKTPSIVLFGTSLSKTAKECINREEIHWFYEPVN